MLLRSIATWMGLAAADTAAAACVINRLGPTTTLPTTQIVQVFTFVATDDCDALMFVANSGALSKRPTRGPVAAVDAHSWEVDVSPTEWRSITGQNLIVLHWSITAMDPASPGERIRVNATNELDSDRDGWTRSEGDVGACDRAADVSPGVTEICGNDVDENCDGQVDTCVEFSGRDADAVVAGTVRTSDSASTLAVSDVNGDGIADLLDAALHNGPGWVYVSFGPVSGTIAAGEDATVWSGRGGYGHSLAGGDADGDGFGDVLAGAFDGDRLASLVLGPLSGEVFGGDIELYAEEAGDETAYHVEITSDVDGDAENDILITAPGSNAQDGAVLVVPGTTTGSVEAASVATYVFRGPAGEADSLGISTAGSDMDSDGITDVVVNGRSAAYVVFGGMAAGTYDVSAVAAARIHSLGGAWYDEADAVQLATLDYDHDGYGDLLVGDPDGESEGIRGVVHLFINPLMGAIDARTDASVTWRGDGIGHLVAAGDCNGDETADYLFGGEDDAYFALGPVSGVVDVETLASFSVQGSADGFAGVSPDGALLFAPDWSGDGIQEVVVGAPRASTNRFEFGGQGSGAAYVYYSDRL